jgi:hypothetical protein
MVAAMESRKRRNGSPIFVTMGPPVMRAARKSLGLALVAIAAIVGFLWLRRASAPSPAQDAATAGEAPARGRSSAAGRPWQPAHLLGGRSEPVGESDLGSFEGEVRSRETGRPIGEVHVTFIGPSGALTATTDAQGHFVLQPPTEGIYELTLMQANGFLPYSMELGESPVELRAQRGSSLRGITLWLAPASTYVARVVDGADRPIAGAEVVRMHPDRHVLSGSLAATMTTDDKGEARFVAPDGTIIEARHPKYGRGRTTIDVGSAISRSLTIVLRPVPDVPGARIVGRVVDASSTPVPDALVTATTELNAASDEARNNAGGAARTDARGEFAIDVAPGPYKVIARDGQLAPARATVEAKSPTSAPLLLVLANAATVRGVVTDEQHRPVVSFSVLVARAVGISRESVAVRTFVDGTGRYEVGALPAGPHVVTVTSADLAPSEERAVTLTNGAAVDADFVLRMGGSVSGIVRDAKTRAPLREAVVSLEGYRATVGQSALSSTAHTDDQGRFEIRALGRGTHSLLVSAQAHHARVVGGLDVRETEALGPIEVMLNATEKGEQARIELVGIGATLSAKGDGLLIGKVLAGGGAAEVGLAEGDLVTRIDGEPTAGLGFAGSIQKIRGVEGTMVTLVVTRSSGGEETLAVPRRNVKN